MADSTKPPVKQWAKPNLLENRDDKNRYWGIEKQSSFQSLMINFHFKDGNFTAIPYSYITRINYNPSVGIEILTTGDDFEIVGRNIDKLYNHLLTHRITFIREADSEFDGENENECFIEKIGVMEIED